MVLFLGGLWGPMFQLDHMKATVQNLRPHNGGGHQLHGQLQHLAAPGAFISVTSKSAESKTATATCRPVGMATSSNHRMPSIRVCGVGRPGGQWPVGGGGGGGGGSQFCAPHLSTRLRTLSYIRQIFCRGLRHCRQGGWICRGCPDKQN